MLQLPCRPWPPQCYGCYIRFDANQKQWDHLLDRKTPGRWIETCWAVEAGLHALGVDAWGWITPFVPGMNLILEKPGTDRPLRRQLFAALSPPPQGLRLVPAEVVIAVIRCWESSVSMLLTLSIRTGYCPGAGLTKTRKILVLPATRRQEA